MNSLVALIQHLSAAEDRAIFLHHLLHVQPQLGGRCATGGVAEFIQSRQRHFGRILRQVGLRVAGRQYVGATQRRGATEDYQID